MLTKLYRPRAGDLAITTERTEYVAGDRVVGRVYFRERSKKNINVDDLKVRIVGEEVVQVFVKNKSANKRDHRASRIFFSLDASVDSCILAGVETGIHEWAFAANLPHHLPSSMVHRDKASKCEIRYKLTAVLGKSEHHCGAKARVELQINGLVSKTLTRDHDAKNQQDTRKSKRMSRDHGSMKIETFVDQPVVCRTGKLTASISYSNDSAVKIDGVRLEILENVRWTALRHEKMACRLLREEFIGVSKFTRNQIQLDIPSASRCTYAGELIDVSHELVVTLEHQSWTLGIPRVRTKIYVHPEEGLLLRRRIKEGSTPVRHLKLDSLKSNFTSARTA